MKNEMAGAGRKYGVMLATWLAFGWPRPAYPVNGIAPGDAVMTPLPASEYRGGNGAQPLHLKLAHVMGVSTAAASRVAATASNEVAQPLHLRLAEIIGTLPIADEMITEPVKTAALAKGDQAPRLRLKFAELIGASSVTAPAEITTIAKTEDVQPLRLRLERAMGASPAVATLAPTPLAEVVAPESRQTPTLQFAPIQYRVGGDIGYSWQHQSYGASKIMSQSLNTNVRATANSFVWQPWFLQVDGGLGLGFSQSSTSGSKSSGNSILGNAALVFLPSSRFPFNAHFAKSNSKQNANLGTFSSSQSTQYGLRQQYRPRTGNAQYLVSYDHDQWKSTDQYVDKQDQFKFDTTQQIYNQTLKVSGESTRNVRSSNNVSTLNNMLTASHNHQPAPNFLLETLANLMQTNYRQDGAGTKASYMQLTSSAFWHPAEKPYSVSGSIRLSDYTSDSTINSAAASQTRTANANLGANYEFSKHIRLSGSGNVNVTETNGNQSVSTNEFIGASYVPDMIALGKYYYNRSVSAGFSNSTGDLGNEQQVTLSPSHGLSRNLDYGGGKVNMSLSQSASAVAGSLVSSTLNLSHSGGVGWSLSEGRKTKMLRLNASDSRAVVGTEYFTQLVNFQATLSEEINRDSSWNGNLTLQATRQGTSTGLASAATTTTTTTTSSNADLSYRHQRALNVPRLRFTSNLRVVGDEYIPVLATPDQAGSLSWENRLDYSIGLTQIQFTTRASKVNKETQTMLWLNLTRQF